jgi:hypothetical protein
VSALAKAKAVSSPEAGAEPWLLGYLRQGPGDNSGYSDQSPWGRQLNQVVASWLAPRTQIVRR